MSPPDPAELRAFCAGSLNAERSAAIDRWLASMPEDEAERRLGEAGVDGPSAPLHLDQAQHDALAFASERPLGRLRPGIRLGEGGMAVVSSAHDPALDRTVALKMLRPRRSDEPLEVFHLREEAFRREAALTAGLVHPAIPQIHDVGNTDGLPAFTMQRLEGRPLQHLIDEDNLPLGGRLDILLRIADAVGYAHSRGVVHRDLTPRNILVADFGAVYVVDWGLATTSGSVDGLRAGTPAWMAPEQIAGAPADPRMDVFALGQLMHRMLSGHPVAHGDGGGDGQRRLPSGLAALVRRCHAADPAERYPDGGAVADDLRRWLADGVTLAQQASRLELTLLRLRRSPQVLTGLGVGFVVAALALAFWWSDHRQAVHEAESRLAQIASTTALEQRGAVAVALDEVRTIRQQQPGLAAAQSLEARLIAAHDLAEHAARLAQVRQRLAQLLGRTRTHGPWADQVQAWRAAIREAGLAMHAEQVEEDARRLREHPLRDAITASLAFLWRAEKARGADYHANQTAALLAAAGSSPGWRAMGRLLGRTSFTSHEPVFCLCDDSEGVLAEAEPTAAALAMFAPEPRLSAAADAVLRQHPGAFWALVASARASLAAGDSAAAERLALIASGAEPDSLLPAQLLSYAALLRGDDVTLGMQVGRGLAIEPDDPELLALRAVTLVRLGRISDAQQLVDRLDAGHLRHHIAHPVGHPMERSVQALVAAGLVIAASP